MAQENHDWGYDRIVGALANLGYQICDQTVGNVLRSALRDCRYLLHDRDSKYTQSFRAIIASGQVEPLVLPARSPNLKTSLTDPQAAWVARKGTDPFFAYDTNYLIDNKAGIIVDAEGTRANRAARLLSPKP